MKRFCALFERLDGTTSTRAKLDALADYFTEAPAADAAWALLCLLGKQRKRLISGRRLRQICLEEVNLPEWLFDDCYAQVGDSAETIALLWGQAPAATTPGGEGPPQPQTEALAVWMERILPGLRDLDQQAQSSAVANLWNGLAAAELLVVNKLLSGGFRVGVGPALVIRALARVSGQDESLLCHRLMGGFQPGAAAYEALLAAGEGDETTISRPYPFFLASPLEPARLQNSAVSDWLVEWKWDGIRGQLIHRRGACFLWSRGEELINPGFPELIQLAGLLPDGTVLDGEVIVWPAAAERPGSFATLQRRLGRIAPGAALLQECPAAFVAYDLLEADGMDLRAMPLGERRGRLEALTEQLASSHPSQEPGAGESFKGACLSALRLSPLLPLASWDQLETLRRRPGPAAPRV